MNPMRVLLVRHTTECDTCPGMLAELREARRHNRRWRELVLRREDDLDRARRDIAALEQELVELRPSLLRKGA